ncbi:MAG: DUF2461 domain-containing protein [Bryobacteraceae bacterium]
MSKTSRFAGFPKETPQFLKELEQNNDREWFQARKDVYERAIKAPSLAFAEALNAEMAGFAAEYITAPKDSVYRIYRDTRFSSDKTPYKTHSAFSFARHGLHKHSGGGFYASVSHKEVEVAGGVYMPGPEELLAIRGYLVEHHGELRPLIAGKKLRAAVGELQGTKLTRPPKGWVAGHPAEDLLRHKQWYFYIMLDAAMVTGPELLKEVVARFRLMTPAVDFFNRPLLERLRSKDKAPGRARLT